MMSHFQFPVQFLHRRLFPRRWAAASAHQRLAMWHLGQNLAFRPKARKSVSRIRVSGVAAIRTHLQALVPNLHPHLCPHARRHLLQQMLRHLLPRRPRHQPLPPHQWAAVSAHQRRAMWHPGQNLAFPPKQRKSAARIQVNGVAALHRRLLLRPKSVIALVIPRLMNSSRKRTCRPRRNLIELTLCILGPVSARPRKS